MRSSVIVGAAMCVLSAGLGACTTSMVRSAEVGDVHSASALGKGQSYLTYFLPQTVLVATVKTSPAGGGPEAAGGPQASVTNNITIGEKGAEAKPETKADAKSDDSIDCAATRKAYQNAWGAHEVYVTTWDAELKDLRALAAGPLAVKADQDKATTALTAFKASMAADNTRLKAAYRLGATIDARCPVALTFDLTTEIAPDTGRAYVLILQDDALSSDQVTAKLDARGMLSSISTTGDDQSGAIIAGAVTSLGTIFGAVHPLNVGLSPAVAAAPPGTTNYAFVEKELLQKTFKQRFLAEIAALEKLPPPKSLPKLPEAPKHPIRYTLAELLEQPQGVEVGAPAYTTGFHLKLTCGGAATGLTRPASIDPGKHGGAKFDKAIEGALVSTPRACAATVTTPPETDGTGQRWWITGLDSRSPMEAHLLKTRFVKRVSSYTFADGQLTQLESTTPSVGAAVVALPGAIVGGLFSGIVQGVKGPQDAYKAQSDYLNAKAGVYTAQAGLIDAQTKAKAAQQPASGAAVQAPGASPK